MAALVALQTALLWEYAAQENRSLDGRALFESNLPPAVLSEKLISRAEQLLMSASCGDEESIRSGAFINTKTKASWVYARFLESFYNKYGDDKELLEHLPALYPAAGTDQAAVPGENEIESMVAAAQQEDVGNEADSECWDLFRLWLKKNPGAFAACTQDLVSEQLEAYRRSAQEIQEQTDCDYFILVGSSSKPLSDTDSEDLAAAENVEDLWDAIELSNIDSEDLAAARQKMRTNDYYLLLEMKNSRTPALSSRYLSGADVAICRSSMHRNWKNYPRWRISAGRRYTAQRWLACVKAACAPCRPNGQLAAAGCGSMRLWSVPPCFSRCSV